MTVTTDPFISAYKGRFSSILRWHQLDDFWHQLKTNAKDQIWYLYAVGQGVPENPENKEKIIEFINEIDILLHQAHDEDYCGVVYVDDVEKPTFIKIFDPNNLGVSCGYSDNPPPPGWILSQIKPTDLQINEIITGKRKRWWQRILNK